MSFRLASLPHKLIANEWLAELSAPLVWYRLSDAAPVVVSNLTIADLSYRLKHDWVFVRQWTYGYTLWYVNGHMHRDGDLPAVDGANGDKSWYVNGRLHRENGLPAIERHSYRAWYIRNRFVRHEW